MYLTRGSESGSIEEIMLRWQAVWQRYTQFDGQGLNLRPLQFQLQRYINLRFFEKIKNCSNWLVYHRFTLKR